MKYKIISYLLQNISQPQLLTALHKGLVIFDYLTKWHERVSDSFSDLSDSRSHP